MVQPPGGWEKRFRDGYSLGTIVPPRQYPSGGGLFREIDAWFAEKLPWPPQCRNQEPVICWFKTENAEEMLNRLVPAMELLERYKHPYFVVYTNTPGKIVYEDKYQVATMKDRLIRIDEVQPPWSPEELE